MTGFIALCALVYSVAGSVTQCRQVADIDCDNNYTPSGDERVCSSDLKDCPTLCHFAKKKCQDPTITILNSGPCTTIKSVILTTITTTTLDPPANLTTVLPAPEHTTALPGQEHTTTSDTQEQPTQVVPSTTTDDFIKKVFCSNAKNITCPTELDPLCGTDGKFYTNDCALAKAKCLDENLQTQDLALCKAANRHRRQLTFV